jgi:hypothetical protein
MVAPKFSRCCSQGDVNLPPLSDPPDDLESLYHGGNTISRQFLENIRTFNNAYAFTSVGCKIDMKFPGRIGPYNFRIHGSLYHRVGSLLPAPGEQPQYAQIYIHDSAADSQSQIRLDRIRNARTQAEGASGTWTTEGARGTARRTYTQRVTRRPHQHEVAIIHCIENVMRRHNPYARKFVSIGDQIRTDPAQNWTMRIVNTLSGHQGVYNTPAAQEVAAIMPGDGMDSNGDRDIVLQLQEETRPGPDGRHQRVLERISMFHRSYWALAYPLLFPLGDDGFTLNIPRRSANNRDRFLTPMDYYAYRLHYRQDRGSKLLFTGGRLLQQFIVDMYAAMEMNRLNFIRFNQQTLRSEVYPGTGASISSV